MSIARRLAIAILAAAVPIASNAGTFTTIATFTDNVFAANPVGPLLYHGGWLYGTGDTFYRVNARNGKIERVCQVDANGTPSYGVTYIDGVLYGSVGDTIVACNIKTQTATTLYKFNAGTSPGGLFFESGLLYGVTQYGGGTLFSINPTTGNLATLYSFKTRGTSHPNPLLLYQNGTIYDTTSGGRSAVGVDDFGDVVSFDLATGVETTLHTFSAAKKGRYSATNLVYHHGKLISDTVRGGDGQCTHDTHCGVTFAINATTGHERILNNIGPDENYSGVTQVGGSLYETVPKGGAGGYGELVQYDLKTGQTTVLHTFTGGTDGADPQAPVIYHGGTFYGTTFLGGGFQGTVFKYVP